MILQAEKHEVITVDSPARAFLALRHRAVDLIVCDQNMPGMTGSVFLERVGAQWPQIRRMMLTADPRMRNDEGVPYRVLYKPFKAAELRAEVARLLAMPAPG